MDDTSLENQYLEVIEELRKVPTPSVWRAEQLDRHLRQLDRELERGDWSDGYFEVMLQVRERAWIALHKATHRARVADQAAERAAARAGFAHPPKAAVTAARSKTAYAAQYPFPTGLSRDRGHDSGYSW